MGYYIIGAAVGAATFAMLAALAQLVDYYRDLLAGRIELEIHCPQGTRVVTLRGEAVTPARLETLAALGALCGTAAVALIR